MTDTGDGGDAAMTDRGGLEMTQQSPRTDGDSHARMSTKRDSGRGRVEADGERFHEPAMGSRFA